MTDQTELRFPLLADEPHWNEFVAEFGGELVAPLIKRAGVQNADYLFREQRVIAELKILQTEFFDPLLIRIGQAAAKLIQDPTDEAFDLFERFLVSTLEAPLKRIIKKANRQIKETKGVLGLPNHRGIILCINDGFVGIPPSIVSEIIFGMLKGSSYTNTRCIVYLTNHLVKFADDDEPALLWWTQYNGRPPEDLMMFVDKLGEEWSLFLANRASSGARPIWRTAKDFRGATVVNGIARGR
jgi:hypothetical protein